MIHHDTKKGHAWKDEANQIIILYYKHDFNKFMKAGSCPICKVELSIKNIDNKYDIQFCSSCRREFWPIQEQQKNITLLESDLQSDLEAVGSEGAGGEGPILLCDDSDLKTWPFGKDYKNKKKDYLADHFPNATIETRKYQPY